MAWYASVIYQYLTLYTDFIYYQFPSCLIILKKKEKKRKKRWKIKCSVFEEYAVKNNKATKRSKFQITKKKTDVTMRAILDRSFSRIAEVRFEREISPRINDRLWFLRF